MVNYTVIQMFVSMILLSYWSHLCLPRLHLFDQKYSENSNIVWYHYNI